MQEIKEKFFEGEHALYGLSNASLENVTFGNGESPLKTLIYKFLSCLEDVNIFH